MKSEVRVTSSKRRWLIHSLAFTTIILWTVFKLGSPILSKDLDQELYSILHDSRVADSKSLYRGPTLNPDASHLHVGSKAMVSSDVDICSTMGKEILLKGGNAADAAVTVALCIGVVNSQSSGIGGGGFIVSHKHSNGDVISIDAREMAPQGSYETMFEENPLKSVVGGLSSGIPGELKGLDELFKRHGSGNLKWSQLLEPVIKLSREGWICNTVCAVSISKLSSQYLEKLPLLAKNWDFIYNEDGSLKQSGDLIKRPLFATTLEIIAKNESLDVFYDPHGPIGSHLIRTNRQFGGLFTAQDFENYEAIVEKPLSLKIDGDYEIFTANGISSGVVLLSGLNLFKKLFNESDKPYLLIHKLIEIMKWMASVRTRLGGNQSRDAYLQTIEKVTSDEWTEDIVSTKYSDNQTFSWEHYNPLYTQTEPHGTAHFSILDENNNGVSMTTTVNLLYGSIVLDPITGIILNNEMDDFLSKKFNNSFDLAPSEYNLVRAGKRPLSSTAPSIILKNGVPDMLIGAAGGSRITTAVFQAIIRIYKLKLNLLDAIARPRFHHQLIPEYVMMEDITMFEQEFGSDVISELENLGHSFKQTGAETTMNGITRVNEELNGVSDYWRKQGEADGY